MEWFADEALWSELYPYVFPLERMAAAQAQVAGIIALTAIAQGAVMDLCCGVGRHALEFARRGFAVTGVDRSPFLLARAREKSAAEALPIEWVLDDMRHFTRPAAFDVACNLFTSFGYFQREEDNLRVLQNVLESLRRGGAFVMDMVGKEHMHQQGLAAQRRHFKDGTVLVQQPLPNSGWTRLVSEWTLIRADGQSRSYRFEHQLYSGEELRTHLLECGFSEVRLYGDLHGAPYTPEAPRLVAVARKA